MAIDLIPQNAPRPNRDELKRRVADFAAKGVFIGTSSWKYSGWCGMLYDEALYVYRGKFAESRFNKNCLAEYAEVFKTVCVDAAYYKFPDRRYLRQWFHRCQPIFSLDSRSRMQSR